MLTWLPLPQTQPVTAPTQAPAQVANKSMADVESRSIALPEREQIGQAQGELFRASPPPPGRRAPAAAPVDIPRPAPPPMPYRVAGKVIHEGGAQVVLAKGDRVLTVREGETLEDGYRIESIHPDRVTLVYLPLDVRESIPVTAALVTDPQPAPAAAGRSGSEQRASGGASSPAQLR